MLTARMLRLICPELSSLSDEQLGQLYYRSQFADMDYGEFQKQFQSAGKRQAVSGRRAGGGRAAYGGLSPEDAQLARESGYGYDKDQGHFYKWMRDEEGKECFDRSKPLTRAGLEVLREMAAGPDIRQKGSSEIAAGSFSIDSRMPASEWRDNFYGEAQSVSDSDLAAIESGDYVSGLIGAARGQIERPDADALLAEGRALNARAPLNTTRVERQTELPEASQTTEKLWSAYPDEQNDFDQAEARENWRNIGQGIVSGLESAADWLLKRGDRTRRNEALW